MPTAKLFMNGRSQAVRLPAAYRFAPNVREVFISRDEKTGDVTLSASRKHKMTLKEFFALCDRLKIPKDFAVPRNKLPPREIF